VVKKDNSLVTKVALIEQKQKYHDEKMEEVFSKIGEIHKAIVGNGTPGLKQEVAVLKTDVSSIKVEQCRHEKVIDGLNWRVALIVGGTAVLSFFGSVILPKILFK